jgi:hypothetical protein
MLNLPTGEIAQYDASGNSTLSTFPFFISDVDEQSNLFGQDPNGNVQLLPRRKPLAQSVWNPRGGFAKGRTGALLTKEITVIGWLNGSAVAFPPINSVNTALVFALNHACDLTLLTFSYGGVGIITNDSDRLYANAFLIGNSGNNEPPPSLDPNAYIKGGDFRAFNRAQVKLHTTGQQILSAEFISSNVALGATVDSCHSAFTPKSLLVSEPHPDNGAKGITASKLHVFQLVEGRVGSEGQKVNMTLNACTSRNLLGLCNAPAAATMPYIWSFPLFDWQAQYAVEHQIFPTYYIYENGKLVNKIPQAAIETFIPLRSTSQIKAADIP